MSPIQDARPCRCLCWLRMRHPSKAREGRSPSGVAWSRGILGIGERCFKGCGWQANQPLAAAIHTRRSV
jgi:hypothetical protein